MLQNDRVITITTGASRKATNWQPQTMPLAELYAKLQTPARSEETLSQYLSLSKGQQDDLKDVGGFVAGRLNGTRRKANAVAGRDIITLDLDNISAGGTNDVLRRLEALGCGYCVYSTRKHMESAPRLRVLLPMNRTCSADEYEPCARRMGEMIGMPLTDPTTFEASRLMYWPSCSADSAYIYYYADKPMVSVDGLLATYADWRDINSWPAHPNAPSPTKAAVKQGDPLAKSGVVGAFCNAYDVEAAMAKFLPGIYEPVDSMPGRYTYTGGSTAGGAVLYDDGKFLYSHHATDPCIGKLVNAFDLVRLHLFGDQDDEAAPGTPGGRLPSYKAMCELAANDQQVRAYYLASAFPGPASGTAVTPTTAPADDSWRAQLAIHSQTLLPLSTINNVLIILENDPNLKGKFAVNEFAGRGEVLDVLPWSKKEGRRAWADSDNSGLYWYLESYYHITGTGKIDAALDLHSTQHAFNDITAYLSSLQWDGKPRLETLFIDYLGAEDTPYTRTITRKAFTAAVARAMTPGAKFDCMTILSGPQGIGKSSLLSIMSRGWFNDSIRTFEGKEASELLQGVWLVEISELDAFRNSDVSRIKQFLSQTADRFRAAYGRHVKELPRRCVFFGTTNSDDYLHDRTGNRRFWPVDVGQQAATKSVWRDLRNEVDQLWAEALMYWRLGEPLYLSGEVEVAAKEQQEEHREVSAREGLIRDFLEREVPVDWSGWDLNQRRVFWNGTSTGEIQTVARDRVCALEIWCEVFDGSKKEMRYSDAQEINSIIAATPGWGKAKQAMRVGPYGRQRGWIKK